METVILVIVVLGLIAAYLYFYGSKRPTPIILQEPEEIRHLRKEVERIVAAAQRIQPETFFAYSIFGKPNARLLWALVVNESGHTKITVATGPVMERFVGGNEAWARDVVRLLREKGLEPELRLQVAPPPEEWFAKPVPA